MTESVVAINVSLPAHCKMILHAVKYPHCSISGVLLGLHRAGNEIELRDAIPCMHSTLLAPPLEVLFIHLDAYCREKGLEIVGLYFANQLLTNNSLNETLARIALDKIPNPVLLQIDNSKLSLNAVFPCLRAYRPDISTTNKWREVDFSVDNCEDTMALTSLAVQNKFHRSLTDFENHLDEPLVSDFYNLDINEKILSLNEL